MKRPKPRRAGGRLSRKTGPADIDRVKHAVHDAFHGTVQPDIDR